MEILQPSNSDLGKLSSSHRFSITQKWGGVIASIVFLCAAPVIYIYLASVFNNSSTGMQEVMNSTPFLKFLPLITALTLLVVAGIYLLNTWRSWNLAVNLYEKGMEYTDQKGTRVINWTDVDQFYVHIVRHYYYAIIPVGTTYQATLQTRAGESLILDNRLSKIRQLCEKVQESLAMLQLPEFLEKIENGERVLFGNYGLDQTGIYHGDKFIAWDDVERVNLETGVFTISKKGKWGNWAKTPFREIPNAEIFYMITDRFGKVRAG